LTAITGWWFSSVPALPLELKRVPADSNISQEFDAAMVAQRFQWNEEAVHAR
jgi:hypothetical protein